MMAGGEGVVSSTIYGPERRTRVAPDARRVVFAAYQPPGIGEEAVRQHLEDIRARVLLVAPAAEVETLQVYGTG